MYHYLYSHKAKVCIPYKRNKQKENYVYIYIYICIYMYIYNMYIYRKVAYYITEYVIQCNSNICRLIEQFKNSRAGLNALLRQLSIL